MSLSLHFADLTALTGTPLPFARCDDGEHTIVLVHNGLSRRDQARAVVDALTDEELAQLWQRVDLTTLLAA